jgi:hypothetical protein
MVYYPTYYSKPLLIRLELIRIRIEIWKIKMLSTSEYILTQTRGIYEGRWVTCLFRQNLTLSSSLHYYVQKQVQHLSLLIFLYSCKIDSTVIFCYLFSSTLLISLNFPFIYVLIFLFFRATFCFTNLYYRLIRPTSPPNYSGLARICCINILNFLHHPIRSTPFRGCICWSNGNLLG